MKPAPFPTLLAQVFLDARDDALLAALTAFAPRAGAARIVLVHVHEVGRAWVGRAPTPPPRPAALDDLQARVQAALPGVGVEVSTHAGRGIDVLVRLSESLPAHLLVVPRAASADAWAEHGQRLLRLADCSVLVLPEGAPLGFTSAAVGMDFSESARSAMAAAEAVAERVRVVAVVDPVGEQVDDEVIAATRAAWRDLVGPDERPELLVVPAASPAEALLGVAGVDLIVCGSRGLTPLAAVLLGSTAEKLGAVCRVPLLVVRRSGEHQGIFQTLFRG